MKYKKRYVLGEGYVGIDDTGNGSEKISLWEDIGGSKIIILHTPKELLVFDQPKFRLVLERIDRRTP